MKTLQSVTYRYRRVKLRHQNSNEWKNKILLFFSTMLQLIEFEIINSPYNINQLQVWPLLQLDAPVYRAVMAWIQSVGLVKFDDVELNLCEGLFLIFYFDLASFPVFRLWCIEKIFFYKVVHFYFQFNQFLT